MKQGIRGMYNEKESFINELKRFNAKWKRGLLKEYKFDTYQKRRINQFLSK